MNKKRRRKRSRRQQHRVSPLWIAALIAIALITAVVVWMATRPADATSDPTPIAVVIETPTSTPRPIGGVDGCRRGPRFQSELELSPQAALATNLTNVKGLAIVDPAGDNGKGTLYQHESWDDAGFVGPFITDRRGHIYVAPVPVVSLVDNPPDEQNRVYRIDSDSQEMTLLADLPAAQLASGNPFGVVGLAYDCETDSLYASSLAGSTASEEVGRIFHIDLATGKVLDQLEDMDAMGIGIYNGPEEKRLYFGLGRLPEIHSIALDEAGNLVGEPRFEFSLAGETTGGRDVVRRIRFGQGPEMTLHLMDFTYSLQVASESLEDVLRYQNDLETGAWSRID